MAIYDRWGDEVTIIDARYIMQTTANGQRPALMVTIKYKDKVDPEYHGTEVYGGDLKADNGLVEITETINKLKGYDLWTAFNKPVKSNPVVRIEVGSWVDGSKGRVIHVRWYRKHSPERGNNSYRDYTYISDSNDRFPVEWRINDLLKSKVIKASEITMYYDGMEVEFIPVG
jgi:hypothetical protein